MNDSDLISRLKSAPLPERPEEYWNDFPSRVRVQLNRTSASAPGGHPWRIHLTWAFDLALTTALVFVCLQYHPLQKASAAIHQHEQYFHAQIARLNAGLHKLMLNTDGMGYLLADAN